MDLGVSGGTLYQLVAHGVSSDMYFHARSGLPYNMRDSMWQYWFVDNEDGFATSDDLVYDGKILLEEGTDD